MYYVVVSQAQPGSPWGIQFGDYDRECAADEMRDMKDTDRRLGERGTRYKILRLANARKSTIAAAMAEINAAFNT